MRTVSQNSVDACVEGSGTSSIDGMEVVSSAAYAAEGRMPQRSVSSGDVEGEVSSGDVEGEDTCRRGAYAAEERMPQRRMRCERRMRCGMNMRCGRPQRGVCRRGAYGYCYYRGGRDRE
jgi:hypothetical protein